MSAKGSKKRMAERPDHLRIWVALDESPLFEGLIYVGTDDGLVQVTEDGGKNWRRVEDFPGVPKWTYVTDVFASPRDANTVFATLNNWQRGDYKPYVVRSADRGRTWTNITGNLPARHDVWSIIQDHVNGDLLFAGTEFGLFASFDGGKAWVQLKGGMPPIQVRDMTVQRRENDLILATFGRGFYILDDYSPLREASEQALAQDAILYPTSDAPRYVEMSSRVVDRGATFFTADNPPFGAVFTYYLKEALEGRAKRRAAAEKKAIEAGETLKIPSFEELRAEDEEIAPAIVLTVRTADGEIVRRLPGKTGKGIHRVSWDLHWPSPRPTALEKAERDPWEREPVGPLAAPGTYTVTVLPEYLPPDTIVACGLDPAAYEPASPLDLPDMDRAVERLRRLILAATRVPRKRIPTRPGQAAKERRLEGKKKRSVIKRMRSKDLD